MTQSKQPTSHALPEAACSGRWDTPRSKGLVPLKGIESCGNGKPGVNKVYRSTSNSGQDPGHALPARAENWSTFQPKGRTEIHQPKW